MAFVVEDGPPDIYATHAWAPLAGTSPPVLNVQGVAGPWAESWIKLLDIPDGWGDLPETIDHREPRTYSEGEVVYPARTVGKTLVYPLEARAQTPEEAQGLVTRCRIGYGLSLSDEGTMTVTPHASIGGPAWTFTARVTNFEPEGQVYKSGIWTPYRKRFSITLRMSDPRFYTGGTGYL